MSKRKRDRDPETQTFTIYVHTNRINGKKYVGQTEVSMKLRWSRHLSAARQLVDGRGCRYLNNAIRKYGKDAFDHEVLETVIGKAAANEAERRWIAQIGCRVPHGYNIAIGGHNGPAHPETRARMSASQKKLAAARTAEERSAMARKARDAQTPEERSAGARKGWAGQTPEQRSARGHRSNDALTKEQRDERARKREAARTDEDRSEAAQKRLARTTPEQLRASARKAIASQTPEQLSGRVKKAWENLTDEQRLERGRAISAGKLAARPADERSEVGRRSWETRRANAAANRRSG